MEIKGPRLTHNRVDGKIEAIMAEESTKRGKADVRRDRTSSSLLLLSELLAFVLAVYSILSSVLLSSFVDEVAVMVVLKCAGGRRSCWDVCSALRSCADGDGGNTKASAGATTHPSSGRRSSISVACAAGSGSAVREAHEE